MKYFNSLSFDMKKSLFCVTGIVNIEVLWKTNWQGYVLLFITNHITRWLTLLCICLLSCDISPHCLIWHKTESPCCEDSRLRLLTELRVSEPAPAWTVTSRPALHWVKTDPSYKVSEDICIPPYILSYSWIRNCLLYFSQPPTTSEFSSFPSSQITALEICCFCFPSIVCRARRIFE